MCGKQYSLEFKNEAVKHVLLAAHWVRDVAARFGLNGWSLNCWLQDALLHDKLLAVPRATGQGAQLAELWSVNATSRASLNPHSVPCAQRASQWVLCIVCGMSWRDNRHDNAIGGLDRSGVKQFPRGVSPQLLSVG